MWDPSRDFFILPFLNRPVAWYGVLFALGFWIGYQVLYWMYKRSLSRALQPQDITHWEGIITALQKGQMPEVWQELDPVLKKRLSAFGLKQNIEPGWKMTLLPLLDRKELERLGFAVTHKAKAKAFCEKLSIYVIIGAVVGARLGHLLFYEPFHELIRDPLVVLRIWEGGLASHGGILGIIIALCLFAKQQGYRLLKLIDWLVIPACIAAGMIRIGNFINQEILGTVTNLPWAVTFGHPADGSIPMPRHPVQLYEALFYFVSRCFFVAH